MSMPDGPNGMARDVDNPSEASHDASTEEHGSDQLDDIVLPAEFEELARNHDHSSQITKAWLLSFKNFKPDTTVSLRFRLDEGRYPANSPHTLIPILTTWLRSWFDGSMSDPTDRVNLSWLLQYTADYLELGHCDLNDDEIHNLCDTLLSICENARQHSHIEGCLTVFLSIAKVRRFPEACLQQTLKILSTAIVILDRPLARIGSCVTLLATGDLHKGTIEALYSQLLALPATASQRNTQSDPSFNACITCARGAARHLSTLLEQNLPNETPVLDLAQVLQVLKDVSEVRILRFSTEVLTLLTNILRSLRSRDVVGSDDLTQLLLDIYEICRDSETIPDYGDTTLSKTKSPKEDPLKREMRYRRDHASMARQFLASAANLLPRLSSNGAERAWDLLKDDLESISAASRGNLIAYVRDRQMCIPGQSKEWAQNLFLVLEKIVIGNQNLTDKHIEEQIWQYESAEAAPPRNVIEQRAKQRIEAIQICANALSTAVLRDPQEEKFAASGSELDIAIKALRRLLDVPLSERSASVLKVLLDKLLWLVSVTADVGSPYSELIITTLQAQVLGRSSDEHPSADTFLSLTKCIRAIFWQGLAQACKVSNQAYQALLKIANCKECKSRRCRLAAMTLLFRIRCDTSGTVYVDRTDDSEHISSALCKTEDSLRSMFIETDDESAEGTKKFEAILAKQLWIYPNDRATVSSWVLPETSVIKIRGFSSDHQEQDLNMSEWLWLATTNLQEDKDWETYSFAIVHLGSQLMNAKLFEHSLDILAGLRGFLCGRVRERKLMFEPPREIGLDKSDIALCFYHILTRFIPYYKLQPPNPHMQESRKGIELVRAFRAGITGDLYYGTARSCIHALTICCYETPEAIGSEYPGIIEAMAKTVSTPHILVHILEFLAQVARLPHLHRYFMEEEIKGIFGICIAALKSLMSKDEPNKPPSLNDAKRQSSHANLPGHRGAVHTPYRAAMLKEKGLKQYSCALAYHTMIFWFLSIPIGQRHKYVNIVTKQLTWIDTRGNATVDEQTIVLVDLMQRTAFSDLPETARDESFSGNEYESTSYIDGNSIITIETHKTTGRSQITKRQAAGTTHAVYEPRIQPLSPHQDRAFFHELERRGYSDKVTPSHTFLNLVGSAMPIEISEQPLKLNPNEAYVARALRSIDLKSTVDSHKIAVTLLKEGQTDEATYLANTSGTKSFEEFLGQIGTRVSLKPPCTFVPFGLLYDTDGTETIAWRDRINEVVFEVSTLMPNVDGDEYQARKKSHMGNCLVLIVFNQSGRKWQWDFFKSQATLVNIVITPANRTSFNEDADDVNHECFRVEVLTKEEYQNISAAAETKVMSKATLGSFIRMLALNANIFSECARNELTGDNEFPSSWRYRMQEIIRLRERTQQRVSDNEDTLAKRYDFSRWT